jgi:hypothetical protein
MPLLIPRAILDEAAKFFEDRGAYGCEGTALIAGRLEGIADRLVIPDQVAEAGTGGRVEVTTKGKLELAAALRDGSIYVARIHSHPGEAFHSLADDRNPILTYEGALSIVVPFFGLGLRRGLDACAVLVMKHRAWVELEAGVDRDSVVRAN